MAQPIEDFVDPVTNRTLGSLQAVRRAGRLDGHWHAEIELGYPIDGVQSTYVSSAREWLDDSAAVVQFRFVPPRSASLPTAKNVIAVASGKGGVGKSTIAVNLALGLAKSGARVGLLDADIYGPSQGIMLGIAPGQRPEIKDQKFFIPPRVHGIEAISMSMLASENTPMVWRGPMASGALQQLLRQTQWTDIDYLIVDMPPGTGDIQLTLSQQVSIGGAVIVTTPQEVALADARKGIEMFAKVSVPILGITENMSYFICDGCGKQHSVFGSDGGATVADEYNTSLLGRLPLDPSIRMLTDSGQPPVASDPDSPVSQLFIDLGRKTAAALWTARLETEPPPTISVDAK